MIFLLQDIIELDLNDDWEVILNHLMVNVMIAHFI